MKIIKKINAQNSKKFFDIYVKMGFRGLYEFISQLFKKKVLNSY